MDDLWSLSQGPISAAAGARLGRRGASLLPCPGLLDRMTGKDSGRLWTVAEKRQSCMLPESMLVQAIACMNASCSEAYLFPRCADQKLMLCDCTGHCPPLRNNLNEDKGHF